MYQLCSVNIHYYRITGHLGSGQFGLVNKGVWHSSSGPIEVAVKMLKPDSNEEDKVKFLQEAAIMGQFHHPNIVKLHGVVTVGEPVSTDAICMANVQQLHYTYTVTHFAY